MPFLPSRVSELKVKTDPEKISAVQNWKSIPENKTQLRSFLGLCTYYRKCVKNFFAIAKPLHRLTEEKQNFVWTTDCQQTFEHLKKQLAETPVLAYPSPDTLLTSK